MKRSGKALNIPTICALEKDGKLCGVRPACRLRFTASGIQGYLAPCAEAPRRAAPPQLMAAGGRPRGSWRR